MSGPDPIDAFQHLEAKVTELDRPPFVVSVLGGRHLLWYQNGRLWIADCLTGWAEEWRPVAFSPWTELTEKDAAPGLGGRVLSQQEVGRLVAPHIEVKRG